jgi:hypothetical protein
MPRHFLAVLAVAAAACGSPVPHLQAQGSAAVAAAQGTPAAPRPATGPTSTLPNDNDSVKFLVIGDTGTGDRYQNEVAQRIAEAYKHFKFEFAIMLGDNLYGSEGPSAYVNKFERPYKPLLDDGVKFFAVIGNHDVQSEMHYPPFNMGGQPYYTFRPDSTLIADLTGNDVQFFMLDTETPDGTQLAWLDREMGKSDARWKIPVFHRPIYTSGRYASPARIFRSLLEPIFLRHDVKLALSGHEHFYERTKPQQGITYFISGAAGSLRANDLRRTPLTAVGFDTDYSFMLFEAAGDEMHFQSISRTGQSVDYGVIHR